MNNNDLYINDKQFFDYCKENRLLDDFQISCLQQVATGAVDYIFLRYFVPVRLVDDAIKYCREKIEWYRDLGSIDKMECYNDFINILKSMSMEAEEY